MAAIESIGTGNRMEEQYEKHEKIVEGVFYFFLQKTKNKVKEDRGGGKR